MLALLPTALAAVALAAQCGPDQENGPFKSSVHLMWATPILLKDVRKHEGPEFDEKIAEAVSSAFANYKKRFQHIAPDKLYNKFFDDQIKFLNQKSIETGVGTSIPELLQLPEYSRLVEYIQLAADEYFEAAGLKGLIEERTKDLQLWANVQSFGVGHVAHVHEKTTVSGTYYVHVPEGAGKLLLEDPRGPLKPFGRHIAHEPKAGELILWPPWLRHSVTPNFSKQPRIALSFNIGAGCWEEKCWHLTADVARAGSTSSYMGSLEGLGG